MESSKLAELRGSLLSATNQVGEMQRRMQDAEERSRACERAGRCRCAVGPPGGVAERRRYPGGD